ncbi:MAG: hypothetical protein JWN73_5167 [Betaproteobacteria bacterium]|nr:hypothetical protein [Betaproteobacteria bacterium]
MNKEFVLSFLLALCVVGSSLYGFASYLASKPPVPAPQSAASTASRAISGPVINPCLGGKMLQGECHVPKPDQPGMWIRLADLNRPKTQPVATMNIASGGVTDHERQRLEESDARQRADMAPRDQRIREEVAQQSDDKARCETIDKEMASIDAITRQPLSASLQDYYRGRRKALLDQKFSLRC